MYVGVLGIDQVANVLGVTDPDLVQEVNTARVVAVLARP